MVFGAGLGGLARALGVVMGPPRSPLAGLHPVHGRHVLDRELLVPLLGTLHAGVGLGQPAPHLQEVHVYVLTRCERRGCKPALAPPTPLGRDSVFCPIAVSDLGVLALLLRGFAGILGRPDGRAHGVEDARKQPRALARLDGAAMLEQGVHRLLGDVFGVWAAAQQERPPQRGLQASRTVSFAFVAPPFHRPTHARGRLFYEALSECLPGGNARSPVELQEPHTTEPSEQVRDNQRVDLRAGMAQADGLGPLLFGELPKGLRAPVHLPEDAPPEVVVGGAFPVDERRSGVADGAHQPLQELVVAFESTAAGVVRHVLERGALFEGEGRAIVGAGLERPVAPGFLCLYGWEGTAHSKASEPKASNAIRSKPAMVRVTFSATSAPLKWT